MNEPQYPLDFLQAGLILCPNCLDAYWLPTMIPLPNIREPSGRVIRAFIGKFQVWEDLQTKEKGVSIKPEP